MNITNLVKLADSYKCVVHINASIFKTKEPGTWVDVTIRRDYKEVGGVVVNLENEQMVSAQLETLRDIMRRTQL